MKRKLKRAASCFFAMMMIITIVSMPLSVFAGSADVSLSVSNETGTAGTDVVVSLNISADSHLAAAGFFLQYDNTKLTYKSDAAGSAADSNGPGTSMTDINPAFSTTGNLTTINDSYIAEPDITAGGAMMEVTFTIISGWTGATPLTLTVGDLYDASWNELAYTVTNGSVTVSAPEVSITFDANGGSGTTSSAMSVGSPLTAPEVSKPGYAFTGWLPSVPSTVPAENTTYTAQFDKTTVSITKLAEGFKVNIKGWAANYKYQIWSNQEITSDLLSSETASQWILSNPYRSGSSGAAEADGSISFTIADFVSPDSNYTVAVRIAQANNKYISEIRDTYTPEDAQEVKIAKVLVDGEYSTGREIREITPAAAMTFTVIGNNVDGTVFTAKVLESGTMLTANSATEFGLDLFTLTPGTYTVQFTAGNGETADTKNITVQLYSLDTGIQYGNISNLAFSAAQDNILPKTVVIEPDFTNGSFYYSVGEPGRKAVFTSRLFMPAESINYTITEYGIYQVAGYVNREYEVKIGGYYDDGFIKKFTVSRSQTEPSSATLTASVSGEPVSLADPVAKGTAIRFEADAQIGGIGATPVQYSFWRYDAKGYVLVKDWSSDSTFNWTPARVGIYTIEIRAKGADAGSYEVAKNVRVTVTDTSDQIAQDVVITVNEDELNLNARARAPITIKAGASSSNSEDLLYKFCATDAAMGTNTLQNYSADSDCIWTPRKTGVYTISVLVKNQISFGAYDEIKTFEITVS